MGKKKIKPKASDSGEDSLSTESIDENQEEQEDINKEKLVNKPSTKYSLERSPAVTNPGRRPALSSTSGSYQLKAASIPSGGYEKNLAISNPSSDQKNSFEDPQSLSQEEN